MDRVNVDTQKVSAVASELCRLNQCTEPCEFHSRWAKSITAITAQQFREMVERAKEGTTNFHSNPTAIHAHDLAVTQFLTNLTALLGEMEETK